MPITTIHVLEGRFDERWIGKVSTAIQDSLNVDALPEPEVIMSQHIPQAQLMVYPDAGQTARYQYPELFPKHSKIFLDS